jgi:hypothetical protein
VQAGDVLGLYVGNPFSAVPFDSGGGASCIYGAVGGTIRSSGGMNPEPSTDASVSLLGVYASSLLNLSARLEADVDGDGFGDETQDGCPTVAGMQAGCVARNPGPVGGLPDKTPPRGKISTASDSVKDGALSLKLSSNEAGTATVTGTVNVPNASKVYRLKARTVKVKPNVPFKVKLRFSKKSRRAIFKFLRKGRKLKADVQLIVKDPAGNTNKVKRKVKLRL